MTDQQQARTADHSVIAGAASKTRPRLARRSWSGSKRGPNPLPMLDLGTGLWLFLVEDEPTIGVIRDGVAVMVRVGPAGGGRRPPGASWMTVPALEWAIDLGLIRVVGGAA